MKTNIDGNTKNYWLAGFRDAMPLLGGYVPVALSFGLIANQAGFSTLEVTFISLVIYAGASQFMLVAMIASGAPLWLAVAMTLLINVRHVVYAPNIAIHLSSSRGWWCLMHGLTDQIFALAHARLPTLPENARIAWYIAAASLAWASWVLGSMIGAIAGAEIARSWQVLGEVMPFALPALFLVLLAPRFTSKIWAITLVNTILVALMFTVFQLNNLAIPIAAVLGAITYFLLQTQHKNTEVKDGV